MPANVTAAVLGAGGALGLPMARNIAASGIPVRAWNRTRERALPLAGDGVAVLDSAAEAVDGATIIVTILSDAGAVLEVMDGPQGALAAAGEDVVWLQMSTIGEEGTGRCAAAAQARGVAYVDAPVLGTRQPARDGTLTVLASGAPELRERVAPVLDAVGARTLWVGEAGAGTRLKLAVNMWVLTVVEGAAETIAFTEGLGLDPALFLEAIGGGGLDLPYLRIKAKAMLERDFEPQFSLALAAKDAGLMADSAHARHLDLPLLHTIGARLREAVDEHGEEDFSATYLTSAPAPGVPGPT